MSRLLAVAIYVFEHSFLFLRCCKETCHVVQAFCWGLWRRVSVTRSGSQSGEVAENVTGQLFQPCLVEVLWHQSIMLPCMAGMPRSAPGASLLRSSSRCERSVGKEIAPAFAPEHVRARRRHLRERSQRVLRAKHSIPRVLALCGSSTVNPATKLC